VKIPISGLGGIANWRDAAEFIARGGQLQSVPRSCIGFRIVEDLIDGLSNWMDDRGHRTLADVRAGRCCASRSGEELDLNYHLLAHIDSGQMHQVRAVLDGVRGRGTQAIRRLARDNAGRSSRSSRKHVLGAISARQSARCRSASRCSAVPNDYPAVSWKDYAAGKGSLRRGRAVPHRGVEHEPLETRRRCNGGPRRFSSVGSGVKSSPGLRTDLARSCTACRTAAGSARWPRVASSCVSLLQISPPSSTRI